MKSVIQTGGNLHLEGTRIMYLDSRKFPEFKPIDIPKKSIIFQFEDGKQATFRMDKDCDSMQAFLNRVEKYHELEKENKRLQEQKQKVIALIKDGKFIEVLNLLEQNEEKDENQHR